MRLRRAHPSAARRSLRECRTLRYVSQLEGVGLLRDVTHGSIPLDPGMSTVCALDGQVPGEALSENATFEEVIENAPGNFYMRSRFLLRRLQEGCPLLLSKSNPGQPRGAAEDPGPARHQFGLDLWTWSITSTSTWPLPACSLSPSCSCKAANIVGACTFVPRNRPFGTGSRGRRGFRVRSGIVRGKI